MKNRLQNKHLLYFKNKSKIHYLIIFFLIITNLISVFWSINLKNNAIENFSNPYPLINIARNFVKKENFIINIQPLREDLYDLVGSEKPNRIGVYFEILNTGANISINQNERFWPASLSKVPAAMVVLKKVERGEWKLKNELVLFEEDKDFRFGDLFKKPVGTRFTVEDLIKEMIIKSDNTAFKIFVRNLSTESFEEIIESLGLQDLYNIHYDISAKEFSRIFRALYNSSFLEPYYSELLLKWLSESKFERFLGKSIPDNINFSHKIGEQLEQRTFLDSGIVYVPNRAYLITVLIQINTTEDQENAKEIAERIMHNISKKAYEYVSGV